MFLLLDQYPTPAHQRLWINSKIFVKEGLLYGNWKDVFKNRTVGGSISIPQELGEGLRERGEPFLHNCFKLKQPVDTAVVFKDPLCLRWALRAKRKGLIRRLLAGPFVATVPADAGGMMLDEDLDGLLFFSTWHRDLFLRLAIRPPRRAHLWFAGVNTEKWSAMGSERRKILIYDKNPDADVRAEVFKVLQQRGLEYEVLAYGTYDFESYKMALAQAKLAVFLSRSETQGLAMFEAWSSNVPTLHWNPQIMRYLGQDYGGASSCAYLSADCGLEFKEKDQFAPALDAALAGLDRFQPRHYVARNFSRKHSVERFLEIVRGQETPV